MLQMVPKPVAENVSHPGPKYLCDRREARAQHTPPARSLDNRARAAFHGQDVGHLDHRRASLPAHRPHAAPPPLPANLEDHVLRRRPPGQLARQLDANDLRDAHAHPYTAVTAHTKCTARCAAHLGRLQLPREPGHHVHGVSPAHANCHARGPQSSRRGGGARTRAHARHTRAHPETARVGCVRVRADHEAAGERVVLEHDLAATHDAHCAAHVHPLLLRRRRCRCRCARAHHTSAHLMNDAGSWLPEPHAELGGRGRKEVVDLPTRPHHAPPNPMATLALASLFVLTATCMSSTDPCDDRTS